MIMRRPSDKEQLIDGLWIFILFMIFGIWRLSIKKLARLGASKRFDQITLLLSLSDA